MADVLKALPPKQLAGWYERLADQIAAEARQKNITTSLAAMLMKRWLNPAARGKFQFNAPPHLKTNAYVKDTLLYHRKVYLTQEKARLGKQPSQTRKWAGIIPRLQDGRWNGTSPLNIYYESLVEVPVSVQLKAWSGFGDAGDLDILYALHGFQLRTDITAKATSVRSGAGLKITFSKFQARAIDRYDWDPTKHITVPNPDFGKTLTGAVEPNSQSITVYHSNAKRLEKAGLAAAYDLESHPWSVTDTAVIGHGEIDPNKKL